MTGDGRREAMREWTVGGALIRSSDGLVMVANRRRDGSLDWTPPGGVIDHGEEVLDGLAREVREETGLRVATWSGLAYRVEVEAPGLGWRMRVEAWEALVEGEIDIADPDGIVEEVRHAAAEHTVELIQTAPLWIRVPIGDWLVGRCGAAHPEPVLYRFLLEGEDRATATVVRVP